MEFFFLFFNILVFFLFQEFSSCSTKLTALCIYEKTNCLAVNSFRVLSHKGIKEIECWLSALATDTPRPFGSILPPVSITESTGPATQEGAGRIGRYTQWINSLNFSYRKESQAGAGTFQAIILRINSNLAHIFFSKGILIPAKSQSLFSQLMHQEMKS